ncbi:CPBP family intramembrane glutamic endopeptidase [Xylanimonas sp. McL0601]|uniref:CPBP family intramembrane glutamic endopeptidase n=1 Tax=Xylanimonas sp. McL0601 TaxID=3414739 RepID=UPI003CF823BB
MFGWLVVVVSLAVVYLAWGLAAGDPLAMLRAMLGVLTDVGRLSGASWYVLALIAVRVLFLAAALEESLFRGLLQPWLQRRLPVSTAIGITSMVFSLMHVYPVAYPAGLIFGVIAGILRVRRSTTATFAMHVLTDVTLLVVAVLIRA